MIFNYIDNLIILVCADAECDSVYAFAPLVGIDIATVELTTYLCTCRRNSRI